MIPLLDDQPDVLVPRAALLRRRAKRDAGGALVVSKRARIVGDEHGSTLRLDEDGRGVADEFALGPDALALLRALIGNEEPPPLDPFVRTVLVDAGVLVAPGAGDGGDVLAHASRSFARCGYGLVPDALHPYDVALLRRYVRGRVRRGELEFGDGQVARRYWSHNDHVVQRYHARLTSLVAAVAGVAVRPSYAYLVVYEAGSVLRRHTDREQCEYSVTVPVDYAPEPAIETPWPIRLSLDGRDLAVYQSLGDALVYAGRRIAHRRDALPAGHTSASLLLHYVDADFAGGLD